MVVYRRKPYEDIWHPEKGLITSSSPPFVFQRKKDDREKVTWKTEIKLYFLKFLAIIPQSIIFIKEFPDCLSEYILCSLTKLNEGHALVSAAYFENLFL